MKKANPKRLDAAQFHYYNILKRQNYRNGEQIRYQDGAMWCEGETQGSCNDITFFFDYNSGYVSICNKIVQN